MDWNDWIFLVGGILLIALGLVDRWAMNISATSVFGLLIVTVVFNNIRFRDLES